MGLAYYPSAGDVLVCHFDLKQDVFEGEMCKTRPVIVIGPRLRHRGKVVTVVPLSTSEPVPLESHQVRLEFDLTLPKPFDSPVMWAKCDMVQTVALERLDRFKVPRTRYGGPRRWTSGTISAAQLKDVRVAILHGLGFASLTIHL